MTARTGSLQEILRQSGKKEVALGIIGEQGGHGEKLGDGDEKRREEAKLPPVDDGFVLLNGMSTEHISFLLFRRRRFSPARLSLSGFYWASERDSDALSGSAYCI